MRRLRFNLMCLTGFFLLSSSGIGLAKIEPVSIRHATQARTLSWKEAVSFALKYSPDLKAARYNIESGARSRDIAFGDYLPSISGELDRDRNNPTAGTASDSLNLGVAATTSLFNGFTTTGTVMKTRRTLEATKWTYQDVSATVRFNLRSAYINLLGSKALLEVNKTIQDRRQANADMIQLRYQSGNEHLGSALRAKAIADQAAFNVKQTSRNIESQTIRLGREIGGQFELPVELEGELEKMIPAAPITAPDFAQLAEQIPKVRAAVKTAEAAKAAVIATQGVVWPQITGSANYDYTGARAAQLKDNSFIGVKVNVPFFNGGKNVNAIRKAKADYDAAQANAKSVRDEAVASLADAWTQFVNAVGTIEISKKFLEAARKRSEIVKKEYETGLENFQDFDITEQDIANSETNYVNSLIAALIQEANWQLSRGATLEEVLSEHN